MAKLKPSPIKLSGKHGEDVHVNSRRYAPHVRKSVSPGTKKNEPGLKKQYTRTTFLNQLASEVNAILQRKSDQFKPSTFYQELHKRFRREPLDNRYLLLLQLKGMEVNPAYPLSKLGTPVVSVHVDQKKILFHLKATSHPQVGKYKADCYDYQVMFITWGKEVDAEVKMSAWRYLDEEPPKFKFWFDRKADVKHWLFCVRLELGIKGESIGTLASRGMQVIDAGSFVKKDVEILENREKEKKKVKAAGIAKKKELEIKRVQADTT